MRVAVVGNPGNRRVALFTAAAERAGLPAPEVFPWREVLLHGRVPGPGALVRIDSPGEDAEVDRLLRELGDGGRPAAPAAQGEILGVSAAFAGLRVALGRVAAGGGVLLNQPADILTMTAKPHCHAVLSHAAIPVPPALPGPVRGYESLRERMRAAGWARVFVKPAHGSSASGVLALATAGRRVTAVTSAELSGGRLFNNLRVRRYDDEPTIATIVDLLATSGAGFTAPPGAGFSTPPRTAGAGFAPFSGALAGGDGGGALHVERWYPKAALGGRVLDLRVVVIAGEARHVVVRTSRWPMTNLHLGNARGDVAAVRAAAGDREWAAAMATCVRVAGCFPRTLQVGVDLMFRVGWRDHAVAEVNAFGDLLPGVLADGLDTYGAQMAAIVGGWAGAACAT